MSKWAVVIIILWVILIFKPEILAYVLGVLLLAVWGVIIFAQYKIKKSSKGGKNDYFKFGEYKIYKNK